MKTRIYILLLLVFGCYSSKTSQTDELSKKTIVYILPTKVEETLLAQIQSLNNDNLILDLRRHNEDYIIFLTNTKLYWKTSTFRKVLVGKNYYPLLLDYDYDFGTIETEEEVLKRRTNKENMILRKQEYPIYDGVFNIIFTQQGEILFSGYGDAK